MECKRIKNEGCDLTLSLPLNIPGDQGSTGLALHFEALVRQYIYSAGTAEAILLQCLFLFFRLPNLKNWFC